MRVLVGCEFSGVVREAFRRRGHAAWSCDLLPADDHSRFHIQGDVLVALDLFGPWDLAICHPPCTYLANSANKHLYLGARKANGPDPARWAQMRRAARFFRALLDADVPRIAVENPVMGEHARELVGVTWTQTVQPWQFGHGEIKRTCLWLKNLPPLTPTVIVPGRAARVHHEPPHPDRWKRRSITYAGIADAMAEQWGA